MLNTYCMQGTILGNIETMKMKKTWPHSKQAREWAAGGGWSKDADGFMQNGKRECVNAGREVPCWRELDISYCLVNWKELTWIWYHKKNYKSLRHFLNLGHIIVYAVTIQLTHSSQGLWFESRSVIRVLYHVSRINHTHKPFCGQNPSAALPYSSIHYTSLPTSNFCNISF